MIYSTRLVDSLATVNQLLNTHKAYGSFFIKSREIRIKS